MADKPDTRHLDTAIAIFKGSDKAKRGRPGTTFQLEVFKDYAMLQGPRGKTVQQWQGTPEETKAKAQAYVAGIAGATLSINE